MDVDFTIEGLLKEMKDLPGNVFLMSDEFSLTLSRLNGTFDYLLRLLEPPCVARGCCNEQSVCYAVDGNTAAGSKETSTLLSMYGGGRIDKLLAGGNIAVPSSECAFLGMSQPCYLLDMARQGASKNSKICFYILLAC